MSKPRIIGGVCEFCGVPAERCSHYRSAEYVDAVKEDKIDLYKKLSGEKIIADIVIPHHNRHDHLKNCLDRLPNYIFNIIIVSGGSFAHNCNKGARLAETDTIIFLNDDTIPDPNILIKAVETKGDIIGLAQTIPSDGDKIFYGVDIFLDTARQNGWTAKMIEDKTKVDFPFGFAFVVRRNVWEELGGFDEQFYNGGEDSDFFFRAMEAGKQIALTSEPIVHLHSQSDGRLTFSQKNQEILDKKYPLERLNKLFKLEPDGLKKKLNILVATNHLDNFAGSETWTYTIVKELQRLGHDVEVYTRNKGRVSALLPTVDVPKPKYDLLLINHNKCLDDLEKIEGYKIFTSHGVYPELEQPVIGADKYISVTEEVADHLVSLGYSNYIILNGIDTDRFNIKTEPNDTLQKVLCLAKGEEAAELVKQACYEMGLKFAWINNFAQTEKAMNEADLVVSLGRGALEAMACGREVLILDSRAYMKQGIIGDGLFRINKADTIRERNYSGRALKLRYDLETLKAELRKYNKSEGLKNRQYILDNHNVKEKINQYLKMYDYRNNKSS